ncbi:MAG: stalk domain-containing protein [Defluviitaleaceae bacterium]|nr:stalk domain-containing protein [Defluviitaleaceae bacterium]
MKKMKFIVAIIAMAIVTAVPFVVFAGETNVTVNDKKVDFAHQKPASIDGRTLVPVRGVFEMLDFDVQWNPDKQQVIMTSADSEIIITVGIKEFTTNGKKHNLDVPAQVIGGSTMLPIRAVLESAGFHVAWDAGTSTVQVKNEKPDKDDKPDEKPPETSAQPDATGSDFIGRDVTIRSSANRRYASARKDKQNAPVNAQAQRADTWEVFRVVDAGNGYVAFRAYNGSYVSAVLNDKDVPLRAVAGQIREWERFRIYETDGHFYIRAANGRWVSARTNEKDAPLRATADKPQGWERFQIAVR